MSLDDLARLSDEDRTALMMGMSPPNAHSPAVPPVNSPNFERWRNQVLLDPARARPQTN